MHGGCHLGFVARNCFNDDFAFAIAGTGVDVVFCVVAHHRGEIIAELRAENREFADIATSGLIAAIATPLDEVFELLSDEIEWRSW